MTIAVSAVVRPSKMLCFTVGFMCFFGLIICLMIGFYSDKKIIFLCVPFVLLGMIYFYWGYFRQSYCFEMTDAGRMYLSIIESDSWKKYSPSFVKSKKEVRHIRVDLMPYSTIWPFLLLLRLKMEGGVIMTLIVLPDSTDRAIFKLLSVACRWVVTHEKRDVAA